MVKTIPYVVLEKFILATSQDLSEKLRDVWEAVPYEKLAETLVVGDGILDIPLPFYSLVKKLYSASGLGG